MKYFALFLIVFLANSLGIAAQDFKSELWLEDFEQLKTEMSAHYANLEWAVKERGVNLAQLSAEAETRLRAAKTDAEARIIFENFIKSFGDGHLTIDAAANVNNTAEKIISPNVCSKLGFEKRTARSGLDFSLAGNFQPLDSADAKYFPAGIINLSNKEKIGIVRIGLFMEQMFPDLCETALSDLKIAPDADCDGFCQNRILRQTSNLLTAIFVRRIEQLKKEKINRLMIDLTANGGGTDWYDLAARVLTRKRLQTPRTAFIRHPHWTKYFNLRLADFEASGRELSGSERQRLERAVTAVRTDIAAANESCDRAPLWKNEKINCSLVAPFSQHILSYAKPGELDASPIGGLLFKASNYEYREGIYDGKLLILIDSRTASASEAFTAMLRDNGAASVVGQPSMGAGCGYTDGGIPTTLKNSRLKIKMPDCVRFRADGTNEINGITPDVIVPWRANDSPFQRVKRVMDSLGKM